MAKLIFTQKFTLPGILEGKSTITVRLYVDKIIPLPRNRFRLERWNGRVASSFVVHQSQLMVNEDAVTLYRKREGYLTLPSDVASILTGNTLNHGNHRRINVTYIGPSSNINDRPTSYMKAA